MPRRKLDFASFDAMVADVELLQARGYSKVGKWSLEQVCFHLSKAIEASMDGFAKEKLPVMVRFASLFGGLIRRRLLKTRRMPAGFAGPESFMPGEVSDPAVIAAFVAACRRVERFDGIFHPSPLMGKLTAEQWRQIHLIHGAHHLSFLVPKETAGKE